jgi:hypothetical protein
MIVALMIVIIKLKSTYSGNLRPNKIIIADSASARYLLFKAIM